MRKYPNLGYSAAEEKIRHRSFDPVYLLYGEEDFLIDNLADNLIDQSLAEPTRSFNLDVVYGSDVSSQDILSRILSFPMMDDRRLVLVREFDKVTDKESLVPYLQRPSPTSILALVVPKSELTGKFYDAAAPSVTFVKCDRLSANEIPGWITSRVRSLGKNITPDAADMVAASVNRSLREIQNELDKLFVYIGDARSITSDDVQHLVGMSRQYNIFELQKFIGLRDLPHALEILEHMLRKGESPVGMIVMISRYCQRLWLLHDPSVRSLSESRLPPILSLRPAAIREYRQAARLYSQKELENSFFELTRADELLKSTSMDPAAVMTVLVYNLIKSPRTG